MSEKCFVPNCKNISGVSFPRDPKLKKEWLDGLRIRKLVPKTTDFVCLDHFKESDLSNDPAQPGAGTRNKVKRGAIPCILHPNKQKEELSKVKDEPQEDSETETSQILIKEERLELAENVQPVEKNSIEDIIKRQPVVKLQKLQLPLAKKDSKKPTEEDKGNSTIAEDTNSIQTDVEAKAVIESDIEGDANSRDNELDNEVVAVVAEEVPEADLNGAAGNNEGYQVSKESSETNEQEAGRETTKTTLVKVTSKSNTKQVPVEVVVEPELRMCRACLSSDNIIQRLTDFIEEEVTILSTLMLCAFPLEVSKTDKLPKYICKRCLDELIVAHNFRKKCLATDELLQRNIFIANTKRKLQFENKNTTIKRIRRDHEEDGSKASSSDQDQIELSMQQIHGNEDLSIAISDKGGEITETHTLEHILNALEEGEDQKKTDEDKKRDKKKMMAFRTEPPPRDIEKEQPFVSEVGTMPCQQMTGIYQPYFALVGKYVFEYGLTKIGLRMLKCVLSSCSASARQLQLDSGEFADTVEVTTPHNHYPVGENGRRKQMFYSLMRKRMQGDKTMNVRNLYDEICEHDPVIPQLIPLRSVINEICKHQLFQSMPTVSSFEEFYSTIESDRFDKLHFTQNSVQFYQDKFETEDGAMAIVFANGETLQKHSDSTIMYIDASFKIETREHFSYQLLTVLLWVEDSYYPVLFALINRKTQELFKMIFGYLHDFLAPNLCPQEIVTDYEANLYYALGETYVDSHIGGSAFYYTQNLYKKICSLNLSRDLETNSYFRNIYHMLLMLPLLPVNTILDGLNNIEVQARDLGLTDLTRPLFDHVRQQWIINVTPELFCVHRLENRINENVIAPFKKLRDLLLLTKGKLNKMHTVSIVTIVEKIIELEAFLRKVYTDPYKKSFGRDLSSYQKKNVLRAWHYIENHPRININSFFSKVLGYIRCMENQLWIWGFYRHVGEVDEPLINAHDFSIMSSNSSEADEEAEAVQALAHCETSENSEELFVEGVVDHDGEVVLQSNENVMTTQVPHVPHDKQFEAAFLKYVYQE